MVVMAIQVIIICHPLPSTRLVITEDRYLARSLWGELLACRNTLHLYHLTHRTISLNTFKVRERERERDRERERERVHVHILFSPLSSGLAIIGNPFVSPTGSPPHGFPVPPSTYSNGGGVAEGSYSPPTGLSSKDSITGSPVNGYSQVKATPLLWY